ncbi:Major facilitator transporter (plasmid) [Cupriavidus taiwanensis]|uniref:Major facilitator transporter n=1 Tax=Cupriavidus taiwanensis TaxID=164546 RepID=A0A375HF42_9BURK|nr:MFS transporter [Cupriavidus taiwanensis]SOZ70920.1 Major facilitator transporter [Cupriavidus taiwanensis]SOZ72120.1 Major facilitator transporter [Cupriavidus taiwanensis]SOZ74414.1 Major facilitator transporter [Cupriavidus taiwanensis]SPA03320.1 Major facilitator transporter [Cupriavidus taiwanensis]SPA11295.1 Major facilitator transporter [Cupriavidus taiwanensis]
MTSFLTRAFPVFAEPLVGRFLGGQLASNLGHWTLNITLTLLLWDQTHSASIIGVLNFLLQGPMLFVPMLVGPRLQLSTIRATTLWILSCSLGISLVFLLGAIAGTLSVLSIFLLAGLLGFVLALEWPARQLLLTSSLRDRSLLVDAVAMNSLVFNVGRMAGPAVAAVLFARYGAIAGFTCSVAGLLIMLAAIQSLPKSRSVEATPREHTSIRDVFQFAEHDEFARRYVPMLACFGLFVSSYQTIIPALAASEFGSASRYTGVFSACAGAGALFSALALASLRNSRTDRNALSWTPWLSAAALFAVAASRNAMLSGAGFFLIGMALSYSVTVINSTLQRRCPIHLRGGVVGLYCLALLGGMPLGHLLMGFIANWLGAKQTLCAMCAAMLLSLWIIRASMRQVG